MSSVLTVILNWRTPDLTIRATEAALVAMAGIEGAITIVDNDSGDGSEAKLRAAVADRGWDRVQVLQSGRNGGFGAGNNVGIRAGLPGGDRPDYVYLVNSDAFAEPDTIRILLDHMQAHPKTGIAGSYVHGEDGTPHVASFRFPSLASEFENAAQTGPISKILRRYIVSLPKPDQTVRTDWVPGASLIMRQDMIDRIGAFDEGFFLYFEETDLCLRAARSGWDTYCVPESQVTHIGSVSTGMKNWGRVPGYWFDSRWRYFRKNHGVAVAVGATVAHVGGIAINRLRAALGSSQRRNPPYFLRDMVAHDLRALARGIEPAAVHHPAVRHPAPVVREAAR